MKCLGWRGVLLLSIFLNLLPRLPNLISSVFLPLVLYFCTIYVQLPSWNEWEISLVENCLRAPLLNVMIGLF